MFGKHHRLAQLASGIALAACLAVIAVPSALATPDWYGYYTHGAGTSASAPDVVRRYLAGNAAPTQGTAFAWDRLGANGQTVRPSSRPADPTGSYPDYISAGIAAAVESNHVAVQQAQAAQEAPVRVAAGTGFSWPDAGIGAGFAAGLVLLLLVGTMRLRTGRRGVLTT